MAMYSISEAAITVGLARSTLLYYERQGIVSPTRKPGNNYREYSQQDIDTLILLKQLKKAGLSLKEAAEVLNGKLDPKLLRVRYQNLLSEIETLNMARDVIRSLLIHVTGIDPSEKENRRDVRHWHAGLDKLGSSAHSKWLEKLGFSEKEILSIRWVTRDIADSRDYMKHFYRVYERMVRQGPGSKSSTIRILGELPKDFAPEAILEIGCGTGESCLALAQATKANILATDNHQPFLDTLDKNARLAGLQNQITVANISMSDLDFNSESFDLVWAEGSAYFIGFQEALANWKSFVKKEGFMVITDAVWATESPSPECKSHWAIEYPSMVSAEKREQQASNAGYKVFSSFMLPRSDWVNFYDDMEKQVNLAIEEDGLNKTYANILEHVAFDRKYGEEYGYICLILQRAD